MAAPPIIAKITAVPAYRRIKAYKEKIPPSPLLSARIAKTTYFTVVNMVKVHITQEAPPITNNSLIGLPLTIASKVYKGEVPRSPNTIPTAINSPAGVALFNLGGFINDLFFKYRMQKYYIKFQTDKTALVLYNKRLRNFYKY